MLFSVRERRPLSSSQRKHRGHFMHRCPRSSSFLFFITSMTFAAVKKLIDSKERKIHNDFIIYLISFNIKHSTARLTTTTKQTCLKYARLNINFNPLLEHNILPSTECEAARHSMFSSVRQAFTFKRCEGKKSEIQIWLALNIFMSPINYKVVGIGIGERKFLNQYSFA